MRKRVISKLGDYTSKLKDKIQDWNLSYEIARIHGPENIELQKNEAAILCLAQNGAEFVDTFIEHHFTLGFKHLFIIDNNSSDDTVEKIKRYPAVTIYKSHLPYKIYKWKFKQYLTKKHGFNRWSLYVDIDELFDYPYSDQIDLQELIKYLDHNNYTAVMSHLLDMFSNQPLSRLTTPPMNLKEGYPYYDNSCLVTTEYKSNYNQISNHAIRHCWGGVHSKVFGIDNIYLTKIPFIKYTKGVIPHITSHTSSNVTLADFSAVLLHYKFTTNFFRKIQKVVNEGSYWNNSQTYKKYLDVVKANPDLILYSATSKKLTTVNQLVEDDFLKVSQQYLEKVKTTS